LIATLLAALLQACAAPPAGPHRVSVAAAADLKFLLEDVVEAARQERPELDVSLTFGSSGNLYVQLTNQAPHDLFLSADIDYARRLVEQGLTLPNSEFTYAIGRLVVWTSSDSRARIELLTSPSVSRVAIANPAHAPYGRAAVAALKSAGAYEAVQRKLVYGENVAQALQFVESGAADAGLVPLSLALAPSMRDKGRYWEVPAEWHPPIVQGGVILKWAQDPDAAQALRAFLVGPRGRAMLAQRGFSLPGD
jgi:molybdate transport system substrate-binding protein